MLDSSPLFPSVDADVMRTPARHFEQKKRLSQKLPANHSFSLLPWSHIAEHLRTGYRAIELPPALKQKRGALC